MHYINVLIITCRWDKGDWTDDTDQVNRELLYVCAKYILTILFFPQMLLILQMILDRDGGVDKLDFAKRIQNWRSHGFSEFGDRGGMGIGMTVSGTLSHPQFLTDPHAAAIDVWERSG